ncbi:MAG TPA: hypothetical protein VJW20_15815 [Candidatus Angelobacter sp.]|nr:hypothetical protein [Candidatus Angelobacter sp.]
MRSEYVFAAAKEISNRFLLCRLASVSARRLQIGSKQASESINRSLQLIATAELTDQGRKDTSLEESPVEALALETGSI